jgi:predicted nucleic acid-binding protein
MIFLDASAVLKLYLDEIGSPSVHAARRRFAEELFLTSLIGLEVLTALAKRERSRVIDRRTYAAARARFLNDYQGRYQLLQIGEPTVRRAYDLSDEQRRASMSAMDLLHLSSALELKARTTGQQLVLASADRKLLQTAVNLGLLAFDPETEPFGALLRKLNAG